MQDGANARSPIKLARVSVNPWPMLASAGMALPLPHRGPGSVRIATSVAAGDLRLTVDIDGVGVRSALQPVGLIGRTRNHRSIATGIGILPRHADARLSGFERLHLRRIRAPLVVSSACICAAYARRLSSSSMPAPMRLPIKPPSAAPARPAAMRSPVPPPNCDPIRPPATAPTSVPVFSFGPWPVSGVPAQAAIESAASAVALRRTKDMFQAPR